MGGLSDDELTEERKIKVARKPNEPTQAEIEQHYACNHVPFRSWCQHCVMGKAKNNPHYKILEADQDSVPVISLDYGFMTRPKRLEEDKGMPVLVLNDSESSTIKSHVVPKKGVHPYSVKRTAEDLNLLGYKK